MTAIEPTSGNATLNAGMQLLVNSQLEFKSRLAQRLAHLAECFADDYDGQDISDRAVLLLIEFLIEGQNFRYPDLTVTPGGNIYAEWRGPGDRSLSIEFTDSGEVHYVIFGPNPKHPQLTDRMSGNTTADALPDVVSRLAYAA
jgi:hypothetical protein